MTTDPKPLLAARDRVAENLKILAPHLACRGPGCWGCCRGIVELSVEEFDRLVPLVSEEAWARVAAVPADAKPRTTICPLLDPKTKLCSVYTERPLVCRAYVVVGYWEHCYPDLSGDQQTSTPTSPLLAAASYLTTHERNVLLRELQKKQKKRGAESGERGGGPDLEPVARGVRQ